MSPVNNTCVRMDIIFSAYMHLSKVIKKTVLPYHIIIKPTHVAHLEVFVKTTRNLKIDHLTSIALFAAHWIVSLQPTLVNRLLGGEVSCSTKADKEIKKLYRVHNI